MKILFITNDLSGTNGWSTYCINLINPLNRLGHKIVAATQDTKESRNWSVTRVFEGDPIKYLWYPVRIFTAARRLQKIINRERPDVLHFIAEPYQMTLAFLKVPQNTKVVLTVHGTYVFVPEPLQGFKKVVGTILYKLAHKKVNQVIAISEFTKQRYLAKNQSLARPVTIIHNATNIRPLTEQEIPEKKEPYHAITIGQVKPRKGVQEAIERLSGWALQNETHIIYDVVGDMPENSHYMKNVMQLAQKQEHEFFSTIFHGRVSEVEKNLLLKNASVYIHLEPSHTEGGDVEGFGIGIIDAAAFGVPALVSVGTATEEAIIADKTGYAVDVNEETEVYARISDIIIKHSISQQSLERWAGFHSVDTIATEMKELYL